MPACYSRGHHLHAYRGKWTMILENWNFDDFRKNLYRTTIQLYLHLKRNCVRVRVRILVGNMAIHLSIGSQKNREREETRPCSTIKMEEVTSTAYESHSVAYAWVCTIIQFGRYFIGKFGPWTVWPWSRRQSSHRSMKQSTPRSIPRSNRLSSRQPSLWSTGQSGASMVSSL